MEFINDTNSFIRPSSKFDNNMCDNIYNDLSDNRTSYDISDSLQNTATNLVNGENDDEKNNDGSL